MSRVYRLTWLIPLTLIFGLVAFMLGGMINTKATSGPIQSFLVSEEPTWRDPVVKEKTQWLMNYVFAPNQAQNPYQKFQTLGPDDQIQILQAHQLLQGQIRSNATKVTKTVGTTSNAECLQIGLTYDYSGTAGLKVLTFPAFHEICYANGLILSQYSTASVNTNAPMESFWHYYSADAQVSSGGIGQNNIEITLQSMFRLCINSATVGCSDRANPAYKVIVNPVAGTYQLQGLAIPNPNA